MRNYQYSKLVEKMTPKSPLKKDLINAFVFGGAISCFGQFLRTLYSSTSLTLTESKTLVSVTLVAITAILTIT
ncbi:MAG: SpoVA/SpoVAEb family sporulation membrane protein, partial [Clostridia bacterium]|nr:SpoVA/SpoVAEb family sporulation membrane protein [Clostridia bacterium]